MIRRLLIGSDTVLWVTNNSDDVNVVGSLRWACNTVREGGQIIFADILYDVTGNGDIIIASQSSATSLYQYDLHLKNITLIGNNHTSLKNNVSDTYLFYLKGNSDYIYNLSILNTSTTKSIFVLPGSGLNYYENILFTNCSGIIVPAGYLNNCKFVDCTQSGVVARSYFTNCSFVRVSSTYGFFYNVNFCSSCYFEDISKMSDRAVSFNNCTFKSTTGLLYLDSINGSNCSFYNCSIFNYKFTNISTKILNFYACTYLKTINNSTCILNTAGILFYRCLIVNTTATALFNSSQTFTGSGNLYYSPEVLDTAVFTRYTGDYNDIIDSTLQSYSDYIKYFLPKGMALDFVPNASPTEQYQLFDIRGLTRANPTDVGSYDTSAT